MKVDLTDPESRVALAAFYEKTLLEDVMPFWLRHGLDAECGGILTCLDQDGSVMDTDKSVWFQGRAGWMFATLYNTVEPKPEWLAAARSCVEFLRDHAVGPQGKMYFTLTRSGAPLRMRRYVFSESFAAIAFAAYARATGEAWAREAALRAWEVYLKYSFTPGAMLPKYEPTRPAKGIGAHMIGIATAQELRVNLGDVAVSGRTCSQWIERSIEEIRADFMKPAERALMEVVAPDGRIIEHTDGRTLNPGHAIECAWFLMQEGQEAGRPEWTAAGVEILDWMWERGWDTDHGGLLYFTDLWGLPVQEYWHDMKFWWPHNEAIIATLLAWKLTGERRFAERHAAVHTWSFQHFADAEHGEWFGWLHRDGSVSQRAKGNLFKGPFHLPRMLWYAARLLR
jgi:N-acylglucosamine 2-epimerase